ncbi:hypothetical protein AVEN_260670-1, partial [Araneus ventricosus]
DGDSEVGLFWRDQRRSQQASAERRFRDSCATPGRTSVHKTSNVSPQALP